MKIRIKENALIARLAAKKLKVDSVAIVIGKTIYLHKVSSTEFRQNIKWFRHEMMHVKQFQQYGFLRFVFLYLIESLKKGYEKNKFEIEARNAENISG
jgi:hypothetical protein